MADLLMVKPSSGDPNAMLFTGPDSTEGQLEAVPKGTILKLVGTSGNYYEVEYNNGMDEEAHGGTGMTGTLVAYPYANMYKTTAKSDPIAKINNGTPIELLEDVNTGMILTRAFTTEGWLDGYVEARYIYRDEIESEPAPVMLRSAPALRATPFAAPRASSDTGTVTAPSGLKARSGPSTSNPQVGAFNNGASVTISETKNGWYKVSGTSGWGTLSNVWVSATYVRRNGSNSTAAVSKSDATPVGTTASSSSSSTTYSTAGDDWLTLFANYDTSADNVTANDEYYRQLAEKYMFALGAPPKYNMDIDIQYMDEITAGSGRVMNKTVLSNPSILSLCPGKVRMFPNLIGTEKDTALEAMVQAATGNSRLLDKIQNDQQGVFSGKLYSFEADTAHYGHYLNALCRLCAVLLGIGDKMMPNTSSTLKHFDYTYWTIRKKYSPAAAAAGDPDRTMFRNYWDGLVKTGSRILTAAVDDTTYLNFFLNGNETTVSESITNSVTDSPLAGAINSVSSMSSIINYFTGSGFSMGGTDVDTAIDAVLGDSGDSLASGIAHLGENFLKGGRMVLPKMIEGAQYGKSISCSMKFMSPYGDPYSVFLKCIVPICHLLAMALPKQLSDNMYTYPFVVRGGQLGCFNVDLGIISSINVTRGGSDETSWSADGIATEWDVQLEITPLVDELMITDTTHPVLLCKNECLLDYLGNYCGFDLLACNLSTKVDIMRTLVQNKFLNWPNKIENKITDTMYNKLNRVFRFTL